MGAISAFDETSNTSKPSHTRTMDESITSPRDFSSLFKRLSSKKINDSQGDDSFNDSSEFFASPASNSTPTSTRPKLLASTRSGSFGLRSPTRRSRNTSAYMRSLSPLNFRKAINPPPLNDSEDKDRHVHFVDEEGHVNDVETKEKPALVSILETLPQLTNEELKKVFWTPKEIAKMRSQSKRLAEDIAYKQDRRVLACLEYLYGYGSSDNSKESLTETKSALEYYFSFSVAVRGATIDSGKGTSPSRHKTTTTNLRGLESQVMVVRMADQRMSCIQAVLSMQSKLESGNAKSRESPESILAKASMKASATSRRLARMLGKGDEAAAKSAQ